MPEFTTTRYTVETLESPIITEGLEHQPLNYAVRNTATNTVETYSTFLPMAIETAQQLTEKMNEISPLELVQ